MGENWNERPAKGSTCVSVSAYRPERDVSPQFMSRVAAWIDVSGEALVVLQYIGGAGSRDYAFCRSFPEFEAIVNAASIGTNIAVCRRPQLPIRGVVTEPFIGEALKTIADGAEYMVVFLRRQANSVLSVDGRLGDTHEDLAEALEDFKGEEVALGLCPDFNAPDGDDLISPSKGGIDGPR
jgi:hypothetical protein